MKSKNSILCTYPTWYVAYDSKSVKHCIDIPKTYIRILKRRRGLKFDFIYFPQNFSLLRQLLPKVMKLMIWWCHVNLVSNQKICHWNWIELVPKILSIITSLPSCRRRTFNFPQENQDSGSNQQHLFNFADSSMILKIAFFGPNM